jgi:hypothetical protein
MSALPLRASSSARPQNYAVSSAEGAKRDERSAEPFTTVQIAGMKTNVRP